MSHRSAKLALAVLALGVPALAQPRSSLQGPNELSARTTAQPPQQDRQPDPQPAPVQSALQVPAQPRQAPLVLESRPSPAPGSAPSTRASTTQTPPRGESLPLGAAPAPRSAPATSGATEAPGLARTGSISQTLIALGGVIALAAVAVMIYKSVARRQGGVASSLGAAGRAPSGVLEVLGRYPIGGGVSLVLLRLDRRILLLSQTQRLFGRGAAPGGFRTLCEVTDPEEVASLLLKTQDESGESITRKFNGLLQRFEKNMDDAEPAPKDRGEELVESMRGRIPVVDITRRTDSRDRAEWSGQLSAVRQRLARASAQGQPQAATRTPAAPKARG